MFGKSSKNLNGPPSDGNLSNPSKNEKIETEKLSNTTVNGKMINGMGKSNFTDDTNDQQHIDLNDSLVKLCYEYEIRSQMVQLLKTLYKFKIIIVCDDSDSMKTPTRDEKFTRWTKQCDYVKKLLQFCTLFNPDGVNIHFLNGTICSKVKQHIDVDQISRKNPTGYTPLVPTLERIIEEHKSSQDSIQNLLLLVATDGEAINQCSDSDICALERLLMEERSMNTIYVSFLVLTDKQDAVAYLNEWDRKMPNISVTNHFGIEREKLYRQFNQFNCSFSLGDYLVKILVGSISPNIHHVIANN